MEFVHSITAARAATGTTGSTSVRRSPVGEKPRQALAAQQTVDPRAAGARRYESGQVVWRVQCGDLISRERCVTVFVDDDEVVLVGPPGETARLTAGQLGQLRAALNEAAKQAER